MEVGTIKHICIIESLGDSERKTGEELYSDIIKRRIDYRQSKMTHHYFSVTDIGEFLEALNYYITNAKYIAKGVLIHLEMHGDDSHKGLFLSDGTLIKWEELVDLFRQINVATQNELYLSMATCNGRYLYQGVDPYKKSPYSGFISASISVKPSEIVDNYAILFEELIDCENLVEAYRKMEKAVKSNFYYKDSRRTFEGSFIMTAIDKETLKKVEQDIKKDMRAQGLPELDEVSLKKLMKDVFFDIYNKQKKAFDFRNPD